MSTLPDYFKATNTQSSVEVELTRTPSGVVGDMGRFRATWRDGGQEFTNWYDYDVIVRQVQNGQLKINFEGEHMQLPNIFYFTVYRDPLIYSATRKGDEYVVAWWDTKGRQFHETTYPVSSVEREISLGAWKVDPKSFVESTVLAQDTFEPGIINFDTSSITRLCVETPAPELLTEDPDHGDLAVELPAVLPGVFDFGGLEVNFITFDELLEAVTLEDIRTFAAEVGAVVEVCADYYSVEPFNAEGWSMGVFTAKSESELASLMQAVRTLHKAMDRG